MDTTSLKYCIEVKDKETNAWRLVHETEDQRRAKSIYGMLKKNHTVNENIRIRMSNHTIYQFSAE